MNSQLENILQRNQANFRCVVDFNPATDKLFQFDFTDANRELTTEMISDTQLFSQYIHNKLLNSNAKYGIGGYNENRILYKRSSHFEISGSSSSSSIGEGLEEAWASRSIHLGIDIWAAAGTEVFAPVGGMVHSFAYNDNYSDYGATIILQHQLDTVVFHTLYGHLSKADLVNMQEGKYISRGEVFGHFGEPDENGDWPPHLHFQVIDDLRLHKGDYPGVCTIRERKKYLTNCPNPDFILNMMNQV